MVSRQMEPVLCVVIVLEWDRPLVLSYEGDVAVCLPDPGRNLLRVGDGGRETDQLHVAGAGDDCLLPHRSAAGIRQVVNLVEDHTGDSL